ncbi:uncharacterized protein LOC120430705 [Culex pipiens pallens]|uniref:uncharacterized protein LOC120430705 n=1 Tax=Culex pipiens pallens TaxID=42434 RepID=UPI001954C642|nr:uncharacterized protein LOC120430705 [Culex pipiens pallens]
MISTSEQNVQVLQRTLSNLSPGGRESSPKQLQQQHHWQQFYGRGEQVYGSGSGQQYGSHVVLVLGRLPENEQSNQSTGRTTMSRPMKSPAATRSSVSGGLDNESSESSTECSNPVGSCSSSSGGDGGRTTTTTSINNNSGPAVPVGAVKAATAGATAALALSTRTSSTSWFGTSFATRRSCSGLSNYIWWTRPIPRQKSSRSATHPDGPSSLPHSGKRLPNNAKLADLT